MWTFFILSIFCVIVAIVYLLRRYCAPTVPFVVRLATAYAWLTSFSIVVLVPLDVWTALSGESSKEAGTIIGHMWSVPYWSTQLLTWFLLPFFQVYADAGDFTVWDRVLTSLKENGTLYGIMVTAVTIGMACLFYFERGLSITTLSSLGMGLSNAFGLTAGILLLGYGLVEIPRHIWKSNPEQLLKWCAHRAGRFAEAVIKTTAELETVVTIICANQRQMPRRDPLRPYMDIIADAAEKESPVKPSVVAQHNLDIEQLRAEDLEYNYDKKGLANLRRRLNSAIAEYKGARAQYEEVMMSAFELEDVCKCRQLGEYEPRSGPVNAYTRAVWYYKCLLRPHVGKVVSLLLTVLGLAVIWSEVTITVTALDLSPLSRLVRAASNNQFATQLLVLGPLAYICMCTYLALFKINAFNYNKLLPKATVGASLMQNGSLMARFAAPTCWNFLFMIHMAQPTGDNATVFARKMVGQPPADGAPRSAVDARLDQLSAALNTYLPMLLALHCTLIALGLWDRLIGACMGQKYRFTTDDVDDEYTEKGRALIRKEQDARSKGFVIGEVLHSAYMDLEFPALAGLASLGKGKKKRSWFGLGGRGDDSSTSLISNARSSSSSSPASTGNGGASRWTARLGLGGGGAAAGNAAGSGSGSGAGTTTSSSSSLMSALMKNKYDSGSATAAGGDADATGGVGRSGLDGIFAEITRPRGVPGPGRGNYSRMRVDDEDESADPAEPIMGKWRRGR